MEGTEEENMYQVAILRKLHNEKLIKNAKLFERAIQKDLEEFSETE